MDLSTWRLYASPAGAIVPSTKIKERRKDREKENGKEGMFEKKAVRTFGSRKQDRENCIMTNNYFLLSFT